jgi:hypothetical protein
MKKSVGKAVVRFSKLSSVRFGLACGIVLGLVVFIISFCTAMGFITGGFPVWTDLIADAYGLFGYSVTLLGSVLGFIYAFIDGFILGWLIAVIYNKLL